MRDNCLIYQFLKLNAAPLPMLNHATDIPNVVDVQVPLTCVLPERDVQRYTHLQKSILRTFNSVVVHLDDIRKLETWGQ